MSVMRAIIAITFIVTVVDIFLSSFGLLGFVGVLHSEDFFPSIISKIFFIFVSMASLIQIIGSIFFFNILYYRFIYHIFNKNNKYNYENLFVILSEKNFVVLIAFIFFLICIIFDFLTTCLGWAETFILILKRLDDYRGNDLTLSPEIIINYTHFEEKLMIIMLSVLFIVAHLVFGLSLNIEKDNRSIKNDNRSIKNDNSEPPYNNSY